MLGIMKLFRVEDLVECMLIRRLNRFTVEVLINGEVRSAHLTNTGRLNDYIVEGRRGLCAVVGGPKLNYRLMAVEDEGGYAVLDTITQSKVFEYMLGHDLIAWLDSCVLRKRNFRLGGEVIDYLLDCVDGDVLVELKSAVLRVEGVYASYPDCVSVRARKQIKVLASHANEFKPYVVFMASLPNVVGFKPYCAGDPEILELMRYASRSGVVFKAINAYLDEDFWLVLANSDLPVRFEC